VKSSKRHIHCAAVIALRSTIPQTRAVISASSPNVSKKSPSETAKSNRDILLIANIAALAAFAEIS
jgi:hypothetical protein